jgi:hypothetical protein
MRPHSASASASVKNSRGPGTASRRRRMLRPARPDDGMDDGDMRASTSFDFRREEEDADADVARRKAHARVRRKHKTEKDHAASTQKSIDSRLMLQKDVIESKVQEANGTPIISPPFSLPGTQLFIHTHIHTYTHTHTYISLSWRA